MSIDESGIKDKVSSTTIAISLRESHPLLKLANALPWQELMDIVLPDLQKTAKGKWWMGRPLRLRIHLGVYILQQIFNKTDRQIEYDVKDNAAFQAFCGKNIVKKWHCPDHTKVEEFRSRLSPETHQKLANLIAVQATKMGFADATKCDIDSTVQEANAAYPSDISLMSKLGSMAKKVSGYLNEKFSIFQLDPVEIDIKNIKEKARSCFFDKKSGKEVKKNKLHELWMVTFGPVMNVVKALSILTDYDFKHMPWNILRTVRQLEEKARDYFVDVTHFLNDGKMATGKALSFHLDEISCFNKGKPGKRFQFGRAFQLSRIAGNFMLIGKCQDVRMHDKKCLQPMMEMHASLFSCQDVSVATDKGYYSANNAEFLRKKYGDDSGLQKPGAAENNDMLVNRRSGIEPLIGHAKHGGQLGRSRMKSDEATESSGYTSVLGFNCRQLRRYLTGKARFVAEVT